MDKKKQTTLNLFESEELEKFETVTLNTENLFSDSGKEFNQIETLIQDDFELIDEDIQDTENSELEFESIIFDEEEQSEEIVKTKTVSESNFEEVKEDLQKVPSQTIKVENDNLEEPQRDDIDDSIDFEKDILDIEKTLSYSRSEEEEAEDNYGKVQIKAIGIGGCGCNTIDRMSTEGFEGVELVALDTSIQKLETIEADEKILIGKPIFRGHGSGSDAQRVAEVINDSKKVFEELLKGVDMVFITGGIGGGTGSAGLVEIGKIAKEMGILTIGFATLPKLIEADIELVEHYYNQFIEAVDSNVIVENDKVTKVAKDLPIFQAMKMADKMLVDGIRGISDLIINPGKINLDYADIKTAFSNQGSCIMGIGYGSGESPVVKAINDSIDSELINIKALESANVVIFNITCAKSSITIKEAAEGTGLIYSRNGARDIKHLLFGYSYDDTLGNDIKVTFIATGTEPINFVDYKNNNQNSLFSSRKSSNSFGEDGLFKTVSSSNTKKPDFFK